MTDRGTMVQSAVLISFKSGVNFGLAWKGMHYLVICPRRDCVTLKIVSSTVVKHLPHHPKVRGLSPATAAGTGRERVTQIQIIMIL